MKQIGSTYKAERTLSMKTVYEVRDYAFGQEMLKLRKAIGLTQGRLAEHLGVSERAMRGWEAGVSYPKVEHLKALIALAVQQQAFTAGHESEEIRMFWKVARPKMLLDEHWLCTLLEHARSPQDSVEETMSSAVPAVPQPLEAGTTDVLTPSPAVGMGLVPESGSLHGAGSAQATVPTIGARPHHRHDKTRGRRQWRLMGILIALIILTIIGSAGMLLFQARHAATGQAYPSYLSGNGTLVLFDPLSKDGEKWHNIYSSPENGCQFNGGAYHVIEPDINYFNGCRLDGIFSNFSLEVQLTITQGDCGGVIFRVDGNENFYKFIICQSGIYGVSRYVSNRVAMILQHRNSSAIHTGLGHQNKIAVVSNGNTMTFYVNEQQIDQEQDSSYTSGSISLIACPYYPHGRATDVAYSNIRIWRL